MIPTPEQLFSRLLRFLDAAHAPYVLLVLVFAVLCFFLISFRMAQHCRRRKKGERLSFVFIGSAVIGYLALMACIAIGFVAVAWGWYFYRPRPAPVEHEIFQGVVYKRIVQRRPFPLIAHIVKVDLNSPGIRFLETPGDRSGGREYRAMLTRDFLTSVGAQIAINAGFYQPYYSNGPWDYYPHKGDPVETLGFAASNGHRTSFRRPGYRTLSISADNRARIDDRVTTGYNAISGLPLSLEPDAPSPFSNATKREPRSAVALDATSRTLLIVAIDGRQPNYSEGATFKELAAIIRENGGAIAINLDGGGSTTLAIEDEPGRARMLNLPVQSRIPGLERPVANHLALFARPLTQAKTD